jgi:hypothetical protein
MRPKSESGSKRVCFFIFWCMMMMDARLGGRAPGPSGRQGEPLPAARAAA